jgi:hypothetical protein
MAVDNVYGVEWHGPEVFASRFAWHRHAPRGRPCCAAQQQINRLCRKGDGAVLLFLKVSCHSVIQKQLQHPPLHIVAGNRDFLSVTPLASTGVVL